MGAAALGVTKTHSRPYVSDDNPYSESQLRTLKYRPQFPDRFGCIQDSRAFCQQFFHWYNQEHRYSGIGLLTPAMVHFGEAPAVLARRQAGISLHLVDVGGQSVNTGNTIQTISSATIETFGRKRLSRGYNIVGCDHTSHRW